MGSVGSPGVGRRRCCGSYRPAATPCVAFALLLLFLLSPNLVLRTRCTNLTVGYLTNIMGSHRQGNIISGAMTYSIEEVNKRGILPFNYTLDFIYNDTRGDTLLGSKSVIDMWYDGVIAFFGPENSCEVEATVSASLNLPMISYVSTNFSLLFTISPCITIFPCVLGCIYGHSICIIQGGFLFRVHGPFVTIR